MKKEKKQRTATLIYAGIVLNHKNEKRHSYYEIIDDKPNMPTESMYNKKLYLCSVGGYFTIDVYDGGCKPYTSKFIGHWQDHGWVNKHRAKSDAMELEYSDNKKEKAEKSANPLIEALNPIRQAYRELNWRSKSSMLANVIRYITD